MKMLLFEIKKLFSVRAIILILAAVSLQIGMTFLPSGNKHDYSPGIYRTYIAKFGGEFTEEKYSEIRAIYEEYTEIIEFHTQTVEDYQSGKITLGEFSAHNSEYDKAEFEYKTVEYLLLKSDYFKSIGGVCVYFYDTAWEDFLSGTGFDFIAAFVVIFLIVPVFCEEFQTASCAMIFTSSNGRERLCVQKLFISATAGFLISMLIMSARFVAFSIFHDGGGNQIRNLIGYSGFGAITLAQYYFNNILIKSATWAVGALFVCAISNITQNALFTVFPAFTLIVCAAMLQQSSKGAWKYLLLGGTLSDNYSADLNFPLLIVSFVLKIFIYGTVSVWLWTRCSLYVKKE